MTKVTVSKTSPPGGTLHTHSDIVLAFFLYISLSDLLGLKQIVVPVSGVLLASHPQLSLSVSVSPTRVSQHQSIPTQIQLRVYFRAKLFQGADLMENKV